MTLKIHKRVYSGSLIADESSSSTLDQRRYESRIALTFETFLHEAEGRAREAGRKVHAFVVGLGLGVWQYSKQRLTIYIDTLVSII